MNSKNIIVATRPQYQGFKKTKRKLLLTTKKKPKN